MPDNQGISVKKLHSVRKNVKTNRSKGKVAGTADLIELTSNQRAFHLKYIQKNIEEANQAGNTTWSCIYSSIDKETGEKIFAAGFHEAVAKAFKEEFSGFLLVIDSGPRQELSFDWSGDFER